MKLIKKIEKIIQGVYIHAIDTPGESYDLPPGQFSVSQAINKLYTLIREQKFSRREVITLNDTQEKRIAELRDKSRSPQEETVYTKLLEVDEAQEDLQSALAQSPNPVPDPVKAAQDNLQKATDAYTAAEAALAASTGTVPPSLGTNPNPTPGGTDTTGGGTPPPAGNPPGAV